MSKLRDQPTIEQARKVKDEVSCSIRNLPQLVGVGIGRDENGYLVVKVHLSEEVPKHKIPEIVQGVPVKAEIVGSVSLY